MDHNTHQFFLLCTIIQCTLLFHKNIIHTVIIQFMLYTINSMLMYIQVSCATSTPVLSDRERFPNYFQFLPSFAEFAQTYLGIIREFSWSHVVILLQNENIYTMVYIFTLLYTCNQWLILLADCVLSSACKNILSRFRFVFTDYRQTEGSFDKREHHVSD